jgi:hypothetical protein
LVEIIDRWRKTDRFVAGTDRRAAREQCDRLRRPAVVTQSCRVEQRVNVA